MEVERTLLWTLMMGSVLGLSSPSSANPTSCLDLPSVDIRGNIALPDEVYRTALVLSEEAACCEKKCGKQDLPRPDTGGHPDKRPLSVEQAAERVREEVLDFLKASGYGLATVSVVPEGETLVVNVDEGKLDRIVFVGEDFLTTIQLKFALDLPHDIFNQALLEEKLAVLIEETDVTAASYEVVPVVEVRHEGVQIVEPTIIRGLQLLKPGSPHELRIYIEHEVRQVGTDLYLGLSGVDGLHANIAYDAKSNLVENDRTRLEARIGVHVGQDFGARKTPIGLARARALAQWYAPPLLGRGPRPFLDLEANLFVREREDLDIAAYWYTPLNASLNLEWEVVRSLSLSLGGGVEGRYLSRLRPYETLVLSRGVEETPRQDLRIMGLLRSDIVLDPKTFRRDRRGRLKFMAQILGPGVAVDTKPLAKLRLDFEHVWMVGWDEVWLTGTGLLLFGEAAFYDELTIAEFMRACFAKSIHLERGIGVGAEYRVSLSRDTLKLSVFNDIVLHERLDADRNSIGIRATDTFGLGLHYLAADAFQIDFYTGIGVDREEGFDLDVALRIRQAF